MGPMGPIGPHGAPWAPWGPMGPNGAQWGLHNGPGINPLQRNKRETPIYIYIYIHTKRNRCCQYAWVYWTWRPPVDQACTWLRQSMAKILGSTMPPMSLEVVGPMITWVAKYRTEIWENMFFIWGRQINTKNGAWSEGKFIVLIVFYCF